MSPSQSPGDHPFSLLMVDDHTIVREGLKRVLRPIAHEWSITEAGTGFQAIECLRRQHFDLAIVDLSMPGMSGLELIRRIKSEFPSVAVLVLSRGPRGRAGRRRGRRGGGRRTGPSG